MDLFERVSAFLSEAYGVRVEIGIDRPTATLEVEYANLRAGNIQLAELRSPEQQAFLLCHVFGHLVQHLDAGRYAEIIAKVESPRPVAFTEPETQRYREFEMEGYAWGEVLIRQCGDVDATLLNRYRAYAWVDFTTYFSCLRTGAQTSGAVFQQMLARAMSGPVPELWDIRGKVLPASLILDDVNISVR